MKNIYKKIIVAFILLTILINFAPNICYAEINTSYGNPTPGVDTNEIPSSILVEWIAKMAYNFGAIIEGIMSNVMGWFTGITMFPFSDKIVFNTIPILDVNFINPSKGSLFMDVNGDYTTAGEMIRNVYFTCLSIALGFLGLVIAVTAIRLAFSTIASEKAKYKEAIADTIKTLILLFGLHYLLSFCFYVNEVLVEVASTSLIEMFTGDTSEEVIKALDESSMRNDKKIIENFFKDAEPNWLSPVTWVRETVKELVNIGYDIVKCIGDALKEVGEKVKKAWNSFKNWISGNQTEDDPDEDLVLDPDDEEQSAAIEKVYPRRSAMCDDIKNDETTTHIAAFLLKDFTYRQLYLKWAEGTDQNSLDVGGLGGIARNLGMMLNDVLGIVDIGYMNIRTLHMGTFFIKDGKYESLNPVYKIDESNSLKNIVTSTEKYNNFIIQCEEDIAKLQKQKSGLGWTDWKKRMSIDDKIKMIQTTKVYAKAYYKFVYDGSDKQIKGNSEMITEMGAYFKDRAKYIDVDAGDWAPTSTSIPFGLLYAILIIQSLMLFFAYIKRLLYVVILSVMGPIVIVFDYLSKAI